VEAVPARLIRLVRMDASTTVVAVVGDIDLGATPQLHRHLLVLPDWDTVLDMRGVSLLAARTVINLDGSRTPRTTRSCTCPRPPAGRARQVVPPRTRH
jgi:hypothetical protein